MKTSNHHSQADLQMELHQQYKSEMNAQTKKHGDAGQSPGKCCHETADGGIEIRVGDIRYILEPGMFFDCGPSMHFAATELQNQPWLTEKIKAELFDIAAGRALAAMLEEQHGAGIEADSIPLLS